MPFTEKWYQINLINLVVDIYTAACKLAIMLVPYEVLNLSSEWYIHISDHQDILAHVV